MTCRHGQLVELERGRREGGTDLYRCPKCGTTQRMTAQQTVEQARTRKKKMNAQNDG